MGLWSLHGSTLTEAGQAFLVQARTLLGTARQSPSFPAGDRRSTLRDDLATIPLEGIEPCQVVLASLAVSEMTASNPMRRFGEPAEIAKAVLYLAFDATYTTGAELVVDGGASQL
jgi:NAD(P)-dependent dehydrogenase (short-subunit alcohol dehydrogenase family)